MSNKTKKNANTKKQPSKAKKAKGNKTSARNVLNSAPVAAGRVNRMSKPMMISSRNGNCTIHHREYIADLVAEGTSPSAFTSTKFPINPGMSQTFPWLSQIAPRFEKYHFKKLRFDYETEAPTSSGGSLILAVDYDATDEAPVSKVMAMAYKGSVRSAPWEECSHVSATEDLSQQKQYFVRTTNLPSNHDLKLYDTGNLFACSQNVLVGGSTLGELYVEYEVTLMTPQLHPVPGPDMARIYGTMGSVPSNPIGISPAILTGNPDFITVGIDGTITFLRSANVSIGIDFQGANITGLTYGGTRGSDFSDATAGALFNAAKTYVYDVGYKSITVDAGDTLLMSVTADSTVGGYICIYAYAMDLI